MRMISAVIKPSRLEEVRQALSRIGVTGMTAMEVRGFGRQKGQTEFYRGTEYRVAFLPKIKIEVAVRAEQTDMVLEAIREGAATGKIGDGKVFVFDLHEAMRIRTGERGEDAL